MIPLDRLLARVEAIPALSTAAVDALSALEREDTDATELERILRLDAALTAAFLRLANAACFGAATGSVDNLRSAITRLGLKRVRHVITAAALTAVIPPYIPGYRMDATAFWAHCAATALLTERIYVELATPAPSAAFTAALLHDIGRLAMGELVEEFAGDFERELHHSDRTFEEIERELLGTDHASLGMRVATAWLLPASICRTCAEHHEPERAPEDVRQMVEIIHVADLLSYAMGYGLDLGGLRHRVDEEAHARLALNDAQLERVMQLTRLEIEAMVALGPRAN